MSIAQRAVALAGVALVILAGLASVAIYSVESVAGFYTDYRQLARKQMLVADIGEDFLQARLAAHKYRLTRDPSFADEVASNIDEIVRIDDQLDEILQDATVRGAIDRLRVRTKRYGDEFEALLELPEGEKDLGLRDALDVIGPAVAQDLDLIQDALQASQNRLGPTASAAIIEFERLILIGSAIALSLALIISLYLSRSISAPVRSLTRAMARIAGSNDTRNAVPHTHRSDEIGEMARALEAFRRTLIENEELRLARDQFLAAMSHELRTPLNAIVGFADVLKTLDDEPRNDPRKTEYLSYIRDAGTTLVGLVNDILEIYKDAGKRDSVVHQTVRLSRMIEGAAVTARAAHQDRCGDVFINVESSIRLVCNPAGVRQMTLNLITNAIKYSNPPYHVTVDAALRDDGSLRLSVVDRGVGIPRDQIPAITKPFVRLDHPITSSAIGTGLGLAFVEMQVRQHDAALRIDSTQDVGSTFAIEFPRSRVSVEEHRPEQTALL